MIYQNTVVCQSTLFGLKTGIPFIIQQGGTYSGKTFNIMLALGIYLKEQKERIRVTVVGQTLDHVRDGVMSDWEEINEHLNFTTRVEKMTKKYWVGKSYIQFISVDKFGKAKGPKREILFVNEANYMDYRIFKQLKLRTNICTIIDYNPTGEFWLHKKELPNLKNYLYKLTTYKDNPSVTCRGACFPKHNNR